MTKEQYYQPNMQIVRDNLKRKRISLRRALVVMPLSEIHYWFDTGNSTNRVVSCIELRLNQQN